MKHESWTRYECVLLMLVLFFFASLASAGELFTEIGGGIKVNGTSTVFMPECSQVTHANGWRSSCGGDNPVFIGWVLAWEFDNGRTVVGLLHMSHWFDGPNNPRMVQRGDEHETKMNCICASHRFTWWKR